MARRCGSFPFDEKNRLVVLFEWAWAYFTYQRSARVILDRPLGVEALAEAPMQPPGTDVAQPSSPRR